MSKGTIICLCDITSVMAEPWVDAGYRAVLVDPQHLETSIDGPIERISATILDAMPRLSQIIRSENVVIVIGFPPCTDVAVSGSRWFESKRAKDPHFQGKAALVAEQCRMVGMAAGCPWAFENPVSVFSSIFGSADYTFHPYQFTGLCADDNYTKQTCLWTGNGFIFPQTKPLSPDFGSKMWKLPPSADRASLRSETPQGFAQAVFEANSANNQKRGRYDIA